MRTRLVNNWLNLYESTTSNTITPKTNSEYVPHPISEPNTLFEFILTFIEGNLNQEVDIEKPKKKQRNDYLATDVKIK